MNLLRRLAPARGIVAALLVFVASSATSMASAGASGDRHDDLAIQSTPTLHTPVAHRVADDSRTQRRVPPGANYPLVAVAQVSVATSRVIIRPATVERVIVVRAVPRVYDATAPPSQS